MSPTSLKVTFEQVERGAHLTLQECLAMEYRIVKRIYKENDFTEGLYLSVIQSHQLARDLHIIYFSFHPFLQSSVQHVL